MLDWVPNATEQGQMAIQISNWLSALEQIALQDEVAEKDKRIAELEAMEPADADA